MAVPEMIKLAVNYSPASAALLAEGRIYFDYFKCPGWPDLVAQAAAQHPAAVHFGLEAGSGQLETSDWATIARLREQTGTPYVNVHLVHYARDFPTFCPERLSQAEVAHLLDCLRRDLDAVASRFGAENVIAENIPYHGPGSRFLRPSVEPEIIRRVLDEFGCGLLLDISHARIAAQSLGLEAALYMDMLPVERLRELHFTGLLEVSGQVKDHYPIRDQDWPALDWVLAQIKAGRWACPWLLAFEYGGVGDKFNDRCAPEVLAQQVPELYRRVTSN